MLSRKLRCSIALLAMLTISTISACKPSPPTMDAKTTAMVNAQLVKADTLDGKIDKIVSKCAGCSLAMDGSSEHKMNLSGYSLHLCSDQCKTRFSQDTVKKLLAIEITEP